MKSKRKVTKRIAAWFMCLAMVLTTINLPAFMTEVKAAGMEIPQGTGTSENPYQISNAEELFWFADAVNNGNRNTCAELTNDIVINSEGNPFPIVWTPIGTGTRSFKGTFDGQGHTIKGVYINDETSDYKGLFGYCNGGTIKDLTVVVDITGKGYVGGNISKCYNLGTISHMDSRNYGSVIGYSGSDSIRDCYYLSGQDSVSDSYAESKNADQFASGEVAWLLNGETSEGEDLAWYQTIGTDNYPNFNSEESGVVYFSYADCSATEKSYSNSVGSDTQGNHDFSVNVNETTHKCANCGATGNPNFY